ncbi:MAG TPA: rRNA maturation RNase YbeY [Candidatus Acidoferrum sp.]|jgi:probable rRNA maturation factor|nr:rRNA maturation RNase YbeY [Candidatus Acidoferrum sp.]
MRSKLSIRNRQRTRPVDCKLLARLTRTLFRDLLQKESFDLSVCLVDAPEITRLNEKFLQHRGSTDVITFDYGDAAEPELLSGEIFVCLDEAVKQARRFRTSWQSELVRYVVHGILHLCGYDDRKPRARRTMKREEDRLVKQLTARFAVQQLGRV